MTIDYLDPNTLVAPDPRAQGAAEVRARVEALADDWDRIDRLAHAASSDEPYEPTTYIRELRAFADPTPEETP